MEKKIELSQTEVRVGSQGSVVKIVYRVVGAVQGASVSVSNDADWLSVSTENPRLIEISAQKNDTGEERQATLVVSYPSYDDVVMTVSQSIWEDPITLTIERTEATSVIFSVSTLDKGIRRYYNEHNCDTHNRWNICA